MMQAQTMQKTIKTLTPKVEAKAETTKLPATTQHKAQVTAQTSVMALTPQS